MWWGLCDLCALGDCGCYVWSVWSVWSGWPVWGLAYHERGGAHAGVRKDIFLQFFVWFSSCGLLLPDLVA